jgi:hypothetical protein
VKSEFQREFITFACVALMIVVCLGWVATLLWRVGGELANPKEPQLYTVHFDGIDYQDLSGRYCGKLYSSYITKSGKRIEFRGNFYEVEQ